MGLNKHNHQHRRRLTKAPFFGNPVTVPRLPKLLIKQEKCARVRQSKIQSSSQSESRRERKKKFFSENFLLINQNMRLARSTHFYASSQVRPTFSLISVKHILAGWLSRFLFHFLNSERYLPSLSLAPQTSCLGSLFFIND